MRATITLLILLLLCADLFAENDRIVLITKESSSVQTITKKNLQMLYMGKINQLDKTYYKLYMHKNADAFFKQLLNIKKKKFTRNWRNLIFTGQRRALIIAKDNEMMQNYLTQEADSIGYLVNPKNIPKGFKVISVSD